MSCTPELRFAWLIWRRRVSAFQPTDVAPAPKPVAMSLSADWIAAATSAIDVTEEKSGVMSLRTKSMLIEKLRVAA